MVGILWLTERRGANVLKLRIVIPLENVFMAVRLKGTEPPTVIAMRLRSAQGRSSSRTGRNIATLGEIRRLTEVRPVVAIPSLFVLKKARMGEILRRTELKIAVAGLRQTAIWQRFASMVDRLKGTEHRGVAVLRLRIVQKSVLPDRENLNKMVLKNVNALICKYR